MGAGKRVKYLLVARCGISNKEAQQLIEAGRVCVDGEVIHENVLLTAYSEVLLDGRLVSEAHTYVYYAWYKPRGVECTMNPDVGDNLLQHLPQPLQQLYHVGRLDKASEGLLIMTNDGHLHDRLMLPGSKVAKTYLVTVEKTYDESFIQHMASGVAILGTITEPCVVTPISETQFSIVLTQGMNRQIRRMCYALGNYVTQLLRTGIGHLTIDGMQPGEYRAISRDELA